MKLIAVSREAGEAGRNAPRAVPVEGERNQWLDWARRDLSRGLVEAINFRPRDDVPDDVAAAVRRHKRRGIDPGEVIAEIAGKAPMLLWTVIEAA